MRAAKERVAGGGRGEEGQKTKKAWSQCRVAVLEGKEGEGGGGGGGGSAP